MTPGWKKILWTGLPLQNGWKRNGDASRNGFHPGPGFHRSVAGAASSPQERSARLGARQGDAERSRDYAAKVCRWSPVPESEGF
jgi:hypothetical protein